MAAALPVFRVIHRIRLIASVSAFLMVHSHRQITRSRYLRLVSNKQVMNPQALHPLMETRSQKE